MDGQELDEIIDKVNEQEKRKAKEQIENITEQGIGENQILHNYYYYNLRDKSNFREINNEKYNISREDWRNGGVYTVVEKKRSWN